MRRHLTVRHITEYRYAEPVTFGRHRMMFRPRDSHSLRLLETSLTISPEPVRVHWIYDAFGNSVAFAEFEETKSETLRFVSEISIYHYESPQPTELLLESAKHHPFSYGADELPDLEPVMRVHGADPDGRVSAWAHAVVQRGDRRTLSVLADMMRAIRSEFEYRRRPAPGTQDPAETLSLRTGTCRDFAWLMIEALRSLGFAARFVSGYIYSPYRQNHLGGGATHAWIQVYMPGCGWIEMDPTNGILGNRDLIRVAVARDHRQAVPLSGTFVGRPSANRGMSVSVTITDAGAASVAA